MHPTLHISTEVSYWLALNSNSGALYHLVATYSVSTLAFTFLNNGLANPKSQIFRSQFELTKRFLGFLNYEEFYQISMHNFGRMDVLKSSKQLI